MQLLRTLFGPTKKQLIDDAFLYSATMEAERAKQDALNNLYTALLATIDHTVDWWSYAAARQAQHDAGEEFAVVQKQADAAWAQCHALIGANRE